ncbi:MAG: polysaccharide biosynthesis tyrosine autokinase, partial [Cyanobacteria bacterium P01_G01_bin.49]
INTNEEGGLNLGKLVGVVRRQTHVVVGVSFLVVTAALLKTSLEDPLFRSQVELLTEPVTFETQVLSSTNSQTLSSREETIAVEADEIKLKILKSPRSLSPIVKKLQDKYPELDYDSLERNLDLKTSIQNNDSGNILEISYQNNNENQVRDVIDEVSKAYLRYSLETRQSNIMKGISFLDRQLPVLNREVDLLQGKLQKLREQKNLIDPIVQAELLSAQLDGFKQEQQAVQIDLTEARKLDAASQQQKRVSSIIEPISASVIETERYQDLKKQLLSVETELAKQSAIWTEATPQIQLLRDQRQNLLSLLNNETQQIGEEIQISASQRILQLSLRDQALGEAIRNLELKIKDLSATTRQYVDIQRDLEIATNNLTQFIAKREALKIDVSQQQVPWQILTPPPEDPEALSSGLKRNLVLGTVLGLLLGIACAIGLDTLSDLIYTPEEIQEIIQAPILATIPFNKKVEDFDINSISNDFFREAANVTQIGQNELFQLSQTSAFTEAFNSLYTNICLSSPDKPLKSLVVSSACRGEGKSTIALHLGLIAAGVGRRVLLVDTNLRDPQLHKQVGFMNAFGLTDLIYRDDLHPHSIIQHTWREENLSVLTCGQLPPDPIKLLSSEKMKNLMYKLQESFDLVIYDAPSLVGLADTYLLANQVDGIILVTALGQIRRAELEEAQEQLAFSRTPLLGIVANKSNSGSSVDLQINKLPNKLKERLTFS